MEDVRPFRTECFFMASTLILKGYEPDRKFAIHTNGGDRVSVVMEWDAVPTDLIYQMNKRTITVNPSDLKDVFLPLKKQIFEIKDAEENSNETNRHTS